jgi:predicted NBD/HSP70 family sugar kinase
MPKIQLSVPHQLGQEEAKSRVSKLIADTRSRFGDRVTDVEEAWTGNIDAFRFRAMGFAVDGRLDVQPAEVRIDINLPWAALPFKERVESEVLKHARELLA